jgi:hypothetical protein
MTSALERIAFVVYVKADVAAKVTMAAARRIFFIGSLPV